MNKYRKGEILEPVLILIGLLIVIFIFILPAGRRASNTNNSDRNSNWSRSSDNYNDRDNDNSDSVFERDVRLSSGNAKSETDPAEEFVSITNRGDSSVNISGWFLTNAKGSKPYSLNGRLTYAPSDQATIPQGALFLTSNGSNVLGSIILAPNEKAVLTTGSIGPRSNIPIVSFKVNKCTGYLEKDAEYIFTPSIRKNCTNPEDEVGFEYLDEECQEFIEGMSRCHVPDFDTRNINGESCRNCVDGQPGLSNSCIVFLKSHYNYAGCLTYHSNDPDFYGKEWRVFLDKKWEMWSEKKETITIFDQLGNMVDYLSY